MRRAPQPSSALLLRSGALPEGVQVRPLAVNRDERGSFTEFFCESWKTGFSPVQWSLVRSRRGTLRGMYLHRRHDELFLLTAGRCCVGLRDLRPGSPTKDTSCLLEFAEHAPAFVSFPRGILHGWYFFQDSVHVQAITDEEYARYHADDNLGCRWSDPALEIPWPETPSIVSEQARHLPDLAGLLRAVDQLPSAAARPAAADA
jgi:dTDP-4-dehydrorhamnose 3,5-epimerase